MAYKKSLETKQKILDATKSVVLKNSYANTNIKDIANEIDIPRTLIYYYYPNKESIFDDISNILYQQTLQASDECVDPKQKPILNLILKYILLFKYIVLNDVTRDYFLGYGLYVSHGPEKIKKAREECYPHIENIFHYYNMDVTETILNEYIITSDALIKALFQGIVNKSLDVTLKEVLSYFGRCVILPFFHLTEEEYIYTIDEAFKISETISL